jgi:hypothetical protein
MWLWELVWCKIWHKDNSTSSNIKPIFNRKETLVHTNCTPIATISHKYLVSCTKGAPNDSNQLRRGPREHLKHAPAQGRRRQLHCLVGRANGWRMRLRCIR